MVIEGHRHLPALMAVFKTALRKGAGHIQTRVRVTASAAAQQYLAASSLPASANLGAEFGLSASLVGRETHPKGEDGALGVGRGQVG